MARLFVRHALGYLGWFIGPLPLIATTAGILVVMWRRQFASQSRAAVRGDELPGSLDETGYDGDE
jgi:uncharacterized membrane protein